MPNSHGPYVSLPKGLQELTAGLDLIICDLWGVMHNGESPFMTAIDAITRARAADVQTVFLSNAPRPREHVRAHLVDMGVPASLTDYVVTSGGLARDEVREQFVGAKLYHLGPASDHNTIDGLPVTFVDHPDNAGVILATGLEFPRVEDHRPFLAAAAAKKVPLLCANPDRIVHVGDKLYLCAGSVADLYARMGGEVHWFGKPTAFSLRSCLAECGLDEDTPGSNILMIGDSLQTDMAGAAAAGYRGLFVAGGIHREEYPDVVAAAKDDCLRVEDFTKIFGAGKAIPHAVLKQLIW
jgi:HAD superfamily hydrolase (TIGR01459 family)